MTVIKDMALTLEDFHRGLGSAMDGLDFAIDGGVVRAGTGAAFHAIHVNRIGIALGRHAHVVVHARGAELELNRDFPVGRFAHLLDLQRQVVGSEPVGMACR